MVCFFILLIYFFLYDIKVAFICGEFNCLLTEQVEHRERVLLKELEVLESQVSTKKSSHEPSDDNSTLQTAMKEDEEENRDPNPDFFGEEATIVDNNSSKTDEEQEKNNADNQGMETDDFSSQVQGNQSEENELKMVQK